jgi:hypothetical protein
LGGKGGYFEKLGSKTSDMTFEGLGEMIEGKFAECFSLELMGAERRVKDAQTQDQAKIMTILHKEDISK